MPLIAKSFSLSREIFLILSKVSKSKTLPACQVQRAKIILLAADGASNIAISSAVALGKGSVSKWRNRYLKNSPLFELIAIKDPSKLEQELMAFLSDLPRPGAPSVFTEEQIISILEIACRNPSEFGYETSHWSLNQLVAVTLREGIADSISAKTISRFLKYGENPPASEYAPW